MALTTQERSSYHVFMSTVVHTLRPQKLIIFYDRGGEQGKYSRRVSTSDSQTQASGLHWRAVALEALISTTPSAISTVFFLQPNIATSLLACCKALDTFSDAFSSILRFKLIVKIRTPVTHDLRSTWISLWLLNGTHGGCPAMKACSTG